MSDKANNEQCTRRARSELEVRENSRESAAVEGLGDGITHVVSLVGLVVAHNVLTWRTRNSEKGRGFESERKRSQDIKL